MMILILMTTFALGLSENIETKLPADSNTVYSVAFAYDGIQIGFDWQDREILTDSVCRKAAATEQLLCQQAAVEWLQAECAWYSAKPGLTEKQEDMQYAVCLGADALIDQLSASQVADR